ncbi:hypothetical protein CEXT_394681, partial [Caerostris extrusa]
RKNRQANVCLDCKKKHATSKKNNTALNTSKKQHLAVIKPKDVTSNSADAKSFIKKSIDITQVKVGVKKVPNIKMEESLIETVNVIGYCLCVCLKVNDNTTRISRSYSKSWNKNDSIKETQSGEARKKGTHSSSASGVSEETEEATVAKA